MIEMKNVTKFYGNYCALYDINLSVGSGDVLGLLGPNGAGKTTCMRIITSFIPATSGAVTVAGYDVFEDSHEVRKRLGYLPETPPLYPEMTVNSYLKFIADIKEVPSGKKLERINDVVVRTGISDHANRVIGTLSKGYRQRVGLAGALLNDPEVLILDEPTVGLDPNQIIEIRNLIKDLARDHTVVLSTHILSEVSMTCNKVAIINEGKIVAVDTVENLQGTEGSTSFRVCLKPASEDWKTSFTRVSGTVVSAEERAGEKLFCLLRLTKADDYTEVFKSVVEAGHVFHEITPSRASLEEVFLKLTKGDEEVVVEKGAEQ